MVFPWWRLHSPTPTQRIAAWQSFVDDFTKGPAPYAGEAGWRSALGIVSGPASPYFRLIARIDEEFAREPADAPMPGWITLARQFEQVLQRRPNDADAEARLGRVLAAQKKYDDAETHLQRALSLDPNNQVAKDNLRLLQQVRTQKSSHPN